MTCPVCGEPLVRAKTGRPPTYCSIDCRREAARARRVEAFRAAAASVPKTGDRAEILGLLTVAAKLGSVAAMKLLLEELRRGVDEPTGKPSVIDELTARRDRRT
jgi:uncharacterized Zn finger protein (UPF0148 family)